jgi:hypothetical protein
MKIFVSHAATDHELVGKLLDLLQLGIGLSHNDIFCSSRHGSIPNGEFFVQRILSELNASAVVIAVLSRAYFESQFCLAEAGAGLARKIAGCADFHSLVVPPEVVSKLGGVLYGLQTGNILDPRALSELRDLLAQKSENPPPTSVWEEKRGEFLLSAKGIVERSTSVELVRRLSVETMSIERSTNPDISYKAKLRIVLRNKTGQPIEIGPATWESLISLQQPPVSPLQWQCEEDSGWHTPESIVILVPKDGKFRTWIGFEPSLADKEILRLHVERRLGILSLPVKIGEQDVSENIAF